MNFLSISCKWVGLFVILWAGITTVMNLWDILGDLTLSLVGYLLFHINVTVKLTPVTNILFVVFYRDYFVPDKKRFARHSQRRMT